jgi:hypothetical protein
MAHAEAEARAQRDALREANDRIRTLTGLLPICAGCKRIRDTAGAWSSVETYVSARTSVQFTHGVCPECYLKLYGALGDGEPEQG